VDPSREKISDQTELVADDGDPAPSAENVVLIENADPIDAPAAATSATKQYEFARPARRAAICAIAIAGLIGLTHLVRMNGAETPFIHIYLLFYVVLTSAMMLGFALSIWHCMQFVLYKLPPLVRINSVLLLNAWIIANVFINSGSTASLYLWAPLAFMVLPGSVFWYIRALKSELRNKRSTRLALLQAPTERTPTERTVADPSQLHGLLHTFRTAPTCKADWSLMRESPNSCIKTCHQCGLDVFKPEELSSEDAIRLMEMRKTQPSRAEMAIVRRSDGTFVLGDCSKKRRLELSTVQVALPFVLTGLPCWMAPGLLLPFFNHPVARIVFIALIGLHLFGCWLASLTSSRALRALIFTFFSAPLLFVPVLGPAVITIMQALGPVMPK
jgi:hypothetical protein